MIEAVAVAALVLTFGALLILAWTVKATHQALVATNRDLLALAVSKHSGDVAQVERARRTPVEADFAKIVEGMGDTPSRRVMSPIGLDG